MILLISTFALVFLRAIQQLNVVHHHYFMAAITPFGIAAAEVAVVLNVIEVQWWSIPWMGAGGGLGVIAAMYIHKMIREKIVPQIKPQAE